MPNLGTDLSEKYINQSRRSKFVNRNRHNQQKNQPKQTDNTTMRIESGREEGERERKIEAYIEVTTINYRLLRCKTEKK